MTRVLVTGATGFVGSHAAGILAEEGLDLRCTVRASSDLRWLDGVDAELVEADLADGSGVEPALEGVEAVAHLAGVTRARRDERFRTVNAEGTGRLARAARRVGVGRFVFVSSLAARGPDGADGPTSAYGRSKREAEERLREAAGSAGADGQAGTGLEARGGAAAGSGRRTADGPGVGAGAMEAAVLRPGGVYGPRDTDMLPLFRLADRGWFPVASPDGRVQPIYVEDVARAVVRAVVGAHPGFGPWPLAEERRYRWTELAEVMGRALGRRVRVVRVPGAALVAAGAAAEAAARIVGRPPDFDRRSARDLARHSWTCDPSAAGDALGWRARVGLEEGLERTAGWYRGAGWL